MAKCYMLGSMNNILQKQHHGMETITDSMFSMDEMFASLGRQAKQEVIIVFMNLR